MTGNILQTEPTDTSKIDTEGPIHLKRGLRRKRSLEGDCATLPVTVTSSRLSHIEILVTRGRGGGIVPAGELFPFKTVNKEREGKTTAWAKFGYAGTAASPHACINFARTKIYMYIHTHTAGNDYKYSASFVGLKRRRRSRRVWFQFTPGWNA